MSLLVCGTGKERLACWNSLDCGNERLYFSLRLCDVAAGGMPPHMVPHNFAPAPFSAWGSYATAAQQAGMQQQQQLLAFAQQMHRQGQDHSLAQQQAQMQHAHVQQMMMASYPTFLLGGQFGMVRGLRRLSGLLDCRSIMETAGIALRSLDYLDRVLLLSFATQTEAAGASNGNLLVGSRISSISFQVCRTCAQGGAVAAPTPGGFGNFQGGWAQAQQQQQQQQQTATAPAATGGGSLAPQQRHHTAAVSPFANASQAAGAPGHPGMVQPSAEVGDSEVGDAVNGTAPSSCTGLTRQPTPRECRAQALTKYKQKRKVHSPCFKHMGSALHY